MLRKINIKSFVEKIKQSVSKPQDKEAFVKEFEEKTNPPLPQQEKMVPLGNNIPQVKAENNTQTVSIGAKNSGLKIKEDTETFQRPLPSFNKEAQIMLKPLGEEIVGEDIKPLGNSLRKPTRFKKRISFSQILQDLFNGLVVAFCAITIGLLLAESYITDPVSWHAWIAFVPFTIAIFNIRSAVFSVVFGWIIGAIFYFVSLYWIVGTVMEGTGNHSLSMTALSALSAVLAIQYSLFSLGAYYLKRIPLVWPFSVACLWVGLEILHQLIALKFMAFPWFVLGYTQFEFIHLIQISSFVGAYGVSFIVIFSSLVLGFIFLDINRLLKYFYGVLAICLVLFVISLGHKIIKEQLNYMNSSPNTLRVALMQPYTHKLMISGHHEDVAYTIAGQLEALKGKKAALVIWPESSLPGDLLNNEYMDYIIEQSTSLKTTQLFGGNEVIDGKDYVGAVLVNDTGIIDNYEKTQLVPYGEFLPFKGILGGLYESKGITTFTGDFKTGNEPGKIFNILADISTAVKGKTSNKTKKEEISFGVEICFESIFPSVYRKQALSGADFFVNISNDGWFPVDGAAAYQHLRANVFRAVENRRPLLRSTNTGISAWIDSLGKIRFSTGLDKQESSVFNFVFPDRDTKTFYTSHGDIFAYICLAIAVTLVIVSIVFLNGRDEYGN